MQCEGKDNGIGLCGGDCGIDGNLFFSRFDRWIVSKQNLVFQKISDNLENYRFDLALKNFMNLSGMIFVTGILRYARHS